VFLRTFGLESLKELPELPHVEGKNAEKEGIQNAISELKARESEVAMEQETEESTIVDIDSATEAPNDGDENILMFETTEQ
jgi:hypothetical protein